MFFMSTLEPGLTRLPLRPWAVKVKPELLMAFATSPAVVNAVGVLAFESPAALVLMPLVTALSLPLVVVMVMSSVLALTLYGSAVVPVPLTVVFSPLVRLPLLATVLVN